MEHLDICENGGVGLCRDSGGTLCLRNGGEWEKYDFNAEYAGYFTPCFFTAAAAWGGSFYAAGIDNEGVPHLFSSLSGGVWTEHPLTATDPMGGVSRVRGRIIRILYNRPQRQVLLVTDAGQAVTLPDCPKCIQIRELDGHPTDAEVADGMLRIAMEGGGRTDIPLSALTQSRVSWGFAASLAEQGAVIADLRAPEEYAAWHFGNSVNVPFEQLEAWLRAADPAVPCLFICRTGLLADRAADYARTLGRFNAYSMGGLAPFAHVE